MSDPEFVTHFSIVSMQHANEELTNIAKELPVGIELDTFNDETLWRALQVIVEFLDCDSL
jgi:recombinational DNA repair protein RecR